MLQLPDTRIIRPRRKRLFQPAMGLGLGLPFGIGGGAVEIENPLAIPGCVLWLRSDLGVTVVQGPVVATGTTPPTVTLSGTPANTSQSTIVITITTLGTLGVAIFSWSLNGTTQQTLQVTSASFPLGTTGITASFSAGTYAANNVYTSVLTVSAWADQSTFGNNVTQGTNSYQPVFVSNGGPLGLPALKFKATSYQYLSNATTSVSVTGVTSFIVMQFTSLPTTVQPALQIGNGQVAGITLARISSSNNRAVTYPGVADHTDGAGTVNWETWTTQAAGGAPTLRVNGVTQTLGGGSTAPISGTNGVWVGTDNNGNFTSGYEFMFGNISEVIIYNNVLTAAQIQQEETYLRARYQTW